MTPQDHLQPTPMASSPMALGPAPLASVLADNARAMARASDQSVVSISNATMNTVVAGDLSQANPTHTSLARNASRIGGISVASTAIYSANSNASINTLIEVERRGAERIAQVQTVTKSIRDLTTDCTQARTPRTARPTFTRRPLFNMTSTTNTPLRRASGDLRSLH